MAIHPQSCESTLSSLELFQTPPSHISTEFSKYIEHNSTTSLDRTPTIEFRISSDDSEYLDFSQSFLYLRCRITAKTGGDLKAETSNTDDTVPDRSIVFPVNYAVASIFKQVEIYLAGQLVSSNDTMYPYRAMMETLLSYSKDVKSEFLQAGGYYPESFDLDNRAGVVNADTSAVNPSAVQRFNRTKFGAPFELLGRIHSDFTAQGRYLPGKVGLTVKLHRHQTEFFLMAKTDTDYILHIEKASFFVKHDTITPSIREAHILKWEKDTIKYPIRRTKMVWFTNSAGKDDLSTQRLCEGQLPSRVVLAFVKSAAFNGDLKLNPFNFIHSSIRSVVLRVNGRAIPFDSLDLNFDQNRFLQAYLLLYQGTDSLYTDKSCGITPKQYKNGHTLFCYDLETNSTAGEMSLIKEGTVSAEIKLSTATTDSVTLVAYLEYQDMIEIDSEYKVLE